MMDDDGENEPKWRPVQHERRKLEQEKNATLALGGFGYAEPEPVLLEGPEDWPLEGEEWEMYAPDILERVPERPRAEQFAEEAAAIVGDEEDDELEEPGAEAADEPEPEDEDDEPADEPEVEADDEDEPEEDDEPEAEAEDGEDEDEGEEAEAEDEEDEDDGDEAEAGLGPGLDQATSDDDEIISEEPDVPEGEETPLHTPEDVDPEDVPSVEELQENDATRDDLIEVCRQVGLWEDIEGKGSNGYRRKVDIEDQLYPMLERLHDEG